MSTRRARPITPADANAKARQAQCLELRIEGLSQAAIARLVGVNQSTVSRMISRALKERRDESVDSLRKVESARMEDLHQLAWRFAKEGDMAAAGVLVRLLDRRAKLHGLDAEGANGGAARIDYSVYATVYLSAEAAQVAERVKADMAASLAWSQRSALPKSLVYDADMELPRGADAAEVVRELIGQVVPAKPEDRLYLKIAMLHTGGYRPGEHGVMTVDPAARLAARDDDDDSE